MSLQVIEHSSTISKAVIGLLIAILLFCLFIVGFDQGQLFSIVQGQKAYDGMWMHEFYHDMRHAAGFPCH
ncbi:MAG TPA: CbtB domain-containing protein [Nitrososphaeraceae archaeon]